MITYLLLLASTCLRYAVFGLGSRAYPNFCSFAHTVDNLMLALGADQIYTCGEGDELCGQEESFQLWLKECYLVSGGKRRAPFDMLITYTCTSL